MYSEVFGSRECDCGWQLRRSRELLTVQGGVLIYLDQEGRGAGLRAKADAYRLNNEDGLDTYQAYEKLGLPPTCVIMPMRYRSSTSLALPRCDC